MEQIPQTSKSFGTLSLLIAMVAALAAFLPFAVNTSAWSAVTLRVPGDQGNWWHFLAGAPFFLAFAMIWLSIRSILSLRPRAAEQTVFWSLASISVCGTLLVEAPVLFRMGNLAQMGLHRQLTLVVPGFGLLVLCAGVLIARRKMLSPDSAVMIALCAAYLTNATFCLGMYAPYSPQSGWHVTIASVSAMALQVLWIFFASYRTPASGPMRTSH
jgi:hypothetical protein